MKLHVRCWPGLLSPVIWMLTSEAGGSVSEEARRDDCWPKAAVTCWPLVGDLSFLPPWSPHRSSQTWPLASRRMRDLRLFLTPSHLLSFFSFSYLTTIIQDFFLTLNVSLMLCSLNKVAVFQSIKIKLKIHDWRLNKGNLSVLVYLFSYSKPIKIRNSKSKMEDKHVSKKEEKVS